MDIIELIKRISKYNKTDRIKRIIELSVKGGNVSPFEQLEFMMIQYIREKNGEIEEIKEH